MLFKTGILLLASLFAVHADLDDQLVGEWQDTEMTTTIWRIVHTHDERGLTDLIEDNSDVVHMRSADGRGALFWAYEYGNEFAVKALLEAGADPDMKDGQGISPAELIQLETDEEDDYEDEEEEDDEEEDEE